MGNKAMKIISVASLKGGVGKTGLAVSLANESSLKNKTLSIDLDAQASLTDFYLREEDPKKIFKRNIFHYLSGQTDIEEVLYTSLFHSLIPSSINLSTIGAIMSGDPSAMIEQRNEIRELEFDSIFIDCPPSPSYEFRLGIVSADIVLVPISKDRWSLQGLSLLISETDKLKRSGFFNGEVIAIPSIVTEKEADLIREELRKAKIKVLDSNFLKKGKIKSSLNTGTKLKDETFEQDMIQTILKEIL